MAIVKSAYRPKQRIEFTTLDKMTDWAPLNAAFATAPIDARAWGEIAAIALAAMLVIEFEKRLRR